jgi:hypothetical protein
MLLQGLDTGYVQADEPILVPGVLRDDADVGILVEEVDPVTHKTADVDVHGQ